MTHLIDLSIPWALVVGSEVLLKGSIVLAIAGLVNTVARRTSAASRHAVWSVALLALLALTPGREACGKEPKTRDLVGAVRVNPHVRAADLALERLSRRDADGWKALREGCAEAI